MSHADKAAPTLICKQACGADAYADLVKEAGVYPALAPLQGASPGIPTFVAAGPLAGLPDVYTLLVHDVGQHTGNDVSDAVWAAAVPHIWTVFGRMWAAHIVHGDVARRNIVLDMAQAPPRVTVIDFGRAEMCATDVEINRERECLQAMCPL